MISTIIVICQRLEYHLLYYDKTSVTCWVIVFILVELQIDNL